MYKTNTNYVSRRRQTQASSRSYGRNNNIAIFQPTAKLGAVTQFLMLGILIAVLGIILQNQRFMEMKFNKLIRRFQI